jgi:hypothetical protein
MATFYTAFLHTLCFLSFKRNQLKIILSLLLIFLFNFIICAQKNKTKPEVLVDTFYRKPVFEMVGALMSNMPFVKDDNPPGYTQTYLRFNFQRGLKKEHQAYFMRNFFIQGFFRQMLMTYRYR